MLSRLFAGITPVKQIRAHIDAEVDLSFEKGSAVTVEMEMYVTNYPKLMGFDGGCGGSKGSCYYPDPLKFGFSFDFTNLVNSFINMVEDVVFSMVDGIAASSTS